MTIRFNLIWQRARKAFRLLLFWFVLILLIGPEAPPLQSQRGQLAAIVGQRNFDFVAWEIEAVSTKVQAALVGGHRYLDTPARKALVLDYLALLGDVRQLEAEVAAIFADPEVADPRATTATTQQQINGMRARLAEQQPLAEAILQQQVAAVLVEEGFSVGGAAWPPVLMKMTPLPLMLAVSPRHEIRQIYAIPLEHGLSLPNQEQLETAVYDDLNLSALVAPVGGVGTYPAMLLETNAIAYLISTIAHEWAHHWLTLHPLGIRYNAGPDLRAMNETVASIIGDEIGLSVLSRFYPELVPAPSPEPAPEEDSDDQGPSFDFAAEMRQTRVRAEELLAAGQIEEAEAYMERRRQYFWDNGYRIRKLNQAYFAFYGAYTTSPRGQSDDPIGPAIVALRDNSPSLRVFADLMADITSRDELLEQAATLGARTQAAGP
ncbi:MAG: hypothetical protein R3300_18275 [Candidatus Promineifilaceae bacterium]|nr:hypothetical protein [Candidatus Promineifilaceae bacterium]